MNGLPAPPVFNLTKPPEPLLEIEIVLELTQQLLNIRLSKCNKRYDQYKEELEKSTTNYNNLIYSICTIIFLIILFIVLSFVLIRYIFFIFLNFKFKFLTFFFFN